MLAGCSEDIEIGCSGRQNGMVVSMLRVLSSVG